MFNLSGFVEGEKRERERRGGGEEEKEANQRKAYEYIVKTVVRYQGKSVSFFCPEFVTFTCYSLFPMLRQFI